MLRITAGEQWNYHDFNAESEHCLSFTWFLRQYHRLRFFENSCLWLFRSSRHILFIYFLRIHVHENFIENIRYARAEKD
ncbi:hypothetical protein DsansV1_C35g0228921 [Dioscorea sansibarensis]